MQKLPSSVAFLFAWASSDIKTYMSVRCQSALASLDRAKKYAASFDREFPLLERKGRQSD